MQGKSDHMKVEDVDKIVLQSTMFLIKFLRDSERRAYLFFRYFVNRLLDCSFLEPLPIPWKTSRTSHLFNSCRRWFWCFRFAPFTQGVVHWMLMNRCQCWRSVLFVEAKYLVIFGTFSFSIPSCSWVKTWHIFELMTRQRNFCLTLMFLALDSNGK